MIKTYLKNIGLILIACTTLFSCDKFLEENPKDKLPADETNCQTYISTP